MLRKWSKTCLILGLCVFVFACDSEKGKEKPAVITAKTPLLSANYVGYYPHDVNAFTEGLFFHEGQLYESTGSPSDMPQTRSLFGIVDMTTGNIDVKAELNRNQYFGEGITILNGKLYQLTYQSREGFIYDAETFAQIGSFTIPTAEGWGMTTDGTNLIMSDGTNKLTYLDPSTLKPVRTVTVVENNTALEKLNELEYIDGYVYANVWLTNTIVKIDPTTGKVVGKLDFSAYANESKNINGNSMEMNGIAYNPVTGTVLITGKMWPKMYELRISGIGPAQSKQATPPDTVQTNP
ncbi:MAG: glutaminyl-peptide cyclotransferase [Bacteroidota bacterium]